MSCQKTFNDLEYDPGRLIFFYKDSPVDLSHEECDCDNFERINAHLQSYNADYVNLRPGYLAGIGLCLTKSCNLRCTYCSENSKEFENSELSKTDILAFIDDTIDRWSIRRVITNNSLPLQIYLTGGGEQTYHWNHFVDVIESIKSLCRKNNVPVSFGLTTNGMLNEEQIEYISNNFDDVLVSYDGLPEIQNRNRKTPLGLPTDTIVSNSIKKISKYTRLSIRSTIWHDDFDKIGRMAEHIFRTFTDIEKWELLPVINSGRALLNCKKHSNELSFFDYYLDLKSNNIYSEKITTSFFPNSTNDYYCSALTFCCKCPWLIPDGNIITCMEPCIEKTIIGHVINGHLEYYNHCSDPLLKTVQKIIPECKECIAFRFCRGGCPAKHIMNAQTNGQYDSIFCKSAKQYWEYIFNMVTSGEKAFGWYLETKITEKNQVYYALKNDFEPTREKQRSKSCTFSTESRAYIYLSSNNQLIKLEGLHKLIWDLLVSNGPVTVETIEKQMINPDAASNDLSKSILRVEQLYQQYLESK